MFDIFEHLGVAFRHARPECPRPGARACYRHAEGLSWDGQGEMPAWLRRVVNAGQSVGLFRVGQLRPRIGLRRSSCEGGLTISRGADSVFSPLTLTKG